MIRGESVKMKKEEKVIASICYELSKLDTFEYVNLLNTLIDSTVADIKVPKIHYMREVNNSPLIEVGA